MNFTRRDVGYSIISRFEESFRGFLSKRLLVFFGNYLEGVPSGVIDKAKEHSKLIDWEGPDDFLEATDFSHLKEIVCFRGMYQKYFPDTNMSQEEFQSAMDELYSLRCKIAHPRTLFTSLDLDKLLELSKQMAICLNTNGQDFANFIRELEQQPEKVVIITPAQFVCDSDQPETNVPNNVPTPDYENEGGFIGRDDDIKKVMGLLTADLHRVVTISGAGGVGKTALALRVVQKLMQKSSMPFDGIVWLSAKETKLSYLGIEDIEPTLKNYEQLLDTVLEVMGFGNFNESLEKKEENIQSLFDLHRCILIVVDNLETITDEHIINFILDPHPKTKILITSRKGLGQVERRYELKQLKEKDAIGLFRAISHDKNLSGLATLDDEIIRNYVGKVARYPLAIKWVIGQAAIGKDINQVISAIDETSSDISRFCFEQIYSSLSESARKLICALTAFDDPPSAGILSYVLDIGQHELEDSIRELILVSLVIPEQFKNEQSEISTRYTLLTLTRGYVRRQMDKDQLLKRKILDRLQKIQGLTEETERAKKQYRFSLTNLGATSDEERIAALLTQTGFQKYQAGGYEDAVEDFKRATTIAPRFASVYRNWAAIESEEGHWIEADELMKKAVELGPKDTQIWLTWGNIKRRQDRIKEAQQKYEMAYRLSPEDSVVLNSLGQTKLRLGDYQEADKLFKLALAKAATGDSVRHQIINLSSIADNLRRWAEDLETTDNKLAGLKLSEALEVCQQVILLDQNDPMSLALERDVLLSLGFYHSRLSDWQNAIFYFSGAIVKKPQRQLRIREARDNARAMIGLTRIYLNLGEFDEARKIMTPESINLKYRLKHPKLEQEFIDLWKALNDSIPGKITRVDVNRQFLIISPLSSPSETYLGFIKQISPQLEILQDSLVGKDVYFVPRLTETKTGLRRNCTSIILLEKETRSSSPR